MSLDAFGTILSPSLSSGGKSSSTLPVASDPSFPVTSRGASDPFARRLGTSTPDCYNLDELEAIVDAILTSSVIMTHVLVTGGTGFLGRHLTHRLLERDLDEIRVLTRSYDRELAERGATIVEGSLLEPSDVRTAVEGVDRVYHLAGKVTRRREASHEMYDLHVTGTRHLLEALGEVEPDKIVAASTSGTIGVSEDPEDVATEDSPVREDLVRDWPYYLSKIYAERVCREFLDDHDLPIVLMRPTLLLGPGDRRMSSTRDVALFLQRKIPAVASGGLSFVDARDAADGFIRAMERAEPGNSYLLGQANLSFESFFERLEALSGVSAPSMSLPDRAMVAGAHVLDRAMQWLGQESDVSPISAEMAQYYWYIDASKARRELDWQPRDPDETLHDTIQWLRQHHPELGSPSRQETSSDSSPSTAGSSLSGDPLESFVPDETLEFADRHSDDR